MFQHKKVGFIGGGAMGEALIRGILNAKLLTASQIYVTDISDKRLQYLKDTYGIDTSLSNRQLAQTADILLLTVKPQVVHGVLDDIAASVPTTTMVISVVAGLTISALESKLKNVPVVRVMPNTPVAVGEGMSAIALGQKVSSEQAQMAAAIFGAAGKVITVGEEALDGVTGLSGSGPGYAFVLIDALADAGVRVGLPRASAITLAAQTLFGAAKMVLETGEHPAKLRDMVTSPGGTTIAGIHVMEQAGVRAALIDAVVASANRSRELGQK